MRATRVMGGIGRALVGIGLLVLLFVAYQLWGTNLTESRNQNRLRHELAGRLPPSKASTPSPVVPSTPASGQPLGIIQIPRIGVDKVFVQGVGTADLREGPGHYPGTPLPGERGNAAIAGHRTTYGAPFYNLNELSHGDRILITTPQGAFRYDVDRTFVVDPSDTSVLAPTATPELTLTTCTPRFSASQRLILRATLLTAPAASAPPGERPSASSKGLAGSQGDWLPSLLWGLATATGVALVLVLGPRRRGLSHKLLLYLPGGAGILVLLYFFFENLSRLLPASI